MARDYLVVFRYCVCAVKYVIDESAVIGVGIYLLPTMNVCDSLQHIRIVFLYLIHQPFVLQT